jgi:hypothetical protein
VAQMKLGSIETAKCVPAHKPPCATDKMTKKMTAAKIDPRTTATRSNPHSIARYHGAALLPQIAGDDG